jgi:alginate O-acetyltransferase complex protein AlgJ
VRLAYLFSRYPIVSQTFVDTEMLALEQAGVLVSDPSPSQLPPGETLRFLVQDTHWTPAWMESVAGQLAASLVAHGMVPQPRAEAPRRFHAVAKKVARLGDVADMLGLPEGQRLFAPLDEIVHEVSDGAETRFEPNEKATVLLLGDSFTNIFTLEQMGWGASAGLAPQLALALNQDIDVIARNDAGAHATRELLFNTLAGGEDRLAGKTVVIWELASRELVVGDFRPVDWASLGRKQTDPRVPPDGAEARP